jgi:clan AA aspartic protease
MTTFDITVELGDLLGDRWEPITALVDTGSTFTTAPRSILEGLGVRATRRIPFDLADGRTVESEVGEARVRYAGTETVTLVVFGEPGEPNLLGAHTLEGLLLAVDPVNERLVPVHGLRMLQARPSGP